MNSSTRRWVTPVALAVMVLLLFLGALFGWSQLVRPFGDASKVCVTQQAASLATNQVTVRVFNAGSTSGMAGQVTEQLQAKGFVMQPPSNSDETATATLVIGAKADDPAVKLVAGFFGGAIVQGDNRKTGVVDVIVGDNFGGFNDTAATEIAVPGGEVCLPPASSPSPTTPA